MLDIPSGPEATLLLIEPIIFRTSKPAKSTLDMLETVLKGSVCIGGEAEEGGEKQDVK